MKTNIKPHQKCATSSLSRVAVIWESLEVKGLKIVSYYNGKTRFMVTYNDRNIYRSNTRRVVIAKAEQAARFALKGNDLQLV